MLSADHPNAFWIKDLYSGQDAILNDQTLNGEERVRRLSEHVAKCRERISPDLIVHTGGFRLAAALQGATFAGYTKRMGKFSTGPKRLFESVSLELDQVLADDRNGIFCGKSRISRGSVAWESVGLLGAWRFEDGIAVEYWQTFNGPKWDSFFLASDPAFEGTAIEFWTKEG